MVGSPLSTGGITISVTMATADQAINRRGDGRHPRRAASSARIRPLDPSNSASHSVIDHSMVDGWALKNQGGNGGAAGKVVFPVRGPSSPNVTISAMLTPMASTADLLSHLSAISGPGRVGPPVMVISFTFRTEHLNLA